MTSLTQKHMNNIDRFYTSDPIAFAKSYIKYLSAVISNIDLEEIKSFIEVILKSRETGRTIYFIGNGGSAATASHFANDLSIGTNDYNKPFRAMSLTDNVSILTALGNDFGYEDIFVRQLKVLAKKGDVLVGISASGNSPNMIKAIDYANSVGLITVAITAFDGGKMKKIAQQGIHIVTEPKEYGPAEDAHMVLDHLIGAYLIRLVRNERNK